MIFQQEATVWNKDYSKLHFTVSVVVLRKFMWGLFVSDSLRLINALTLDAADNRATAIWFCYSKR